MALQIFSVTTSEAHFPQVVPLEQLLMMRIVPTVLPVLWARDRLYPSPSVPLTHSGSIARPSLEGKAFY
jgi:hypothetical protein